MAPASDPVGAVHFAGRNRNQIFLLLLLGPELQQRHAKQRVVDRNNSSVGRVRSGDLRHDERVADGVETRATVFFGNFNTHESQFGGSLYRGYLVLSKFARCVTNHLLIFSE
jgi:hypothetical protein